MKHACVALHLPGAGALGRCQGAGAQQRGQPRGLKTASQQCWRGRPAGQACRHPPAQCVCVCVCARALVHEHSFQHSKPVQNCLSKMSAAINTSDHPICSCGGFSAQ
eukprot:1139010-Pelagomonas_calceolata.AAC.3